MIAVCEFTWRRRKLAVDEDVRNITGIISTFVQTKGNRLITGVVKSYLKMNLPSLMPSLLFTRIKIHLSSSSGLSNSRDVGGVQVCNQSVRRRHETKSCNHCGAERSQQGKLENDVQGTFLCPFLSSCGEPSFVKPFNCT